MIALLLSEHPAASASCEVDPKNCSVRGDVIYASVEMALSFLVQRNVVARGNFSPIVHGHLSDTVLPYLLVPG